MENNLATTLSLGLLVMTLGVRRVQFISQLSTWHLAEETLAVQPNISADKEILYSAQPTSQASLSSLSYFH